MNGHLWHIDEPPSQSVNELSHDFGLSRPMSVVLGSRGVAPADLTDFLHPKLRHLSDPLQIPGMVRAVARIWHAITNGERILVHGDYDTDGITSTALLSWVLKENGADVDCFVPHRIDDGYGFTADSVTKALTPEHRLIITVDCGITSCAATAAANERGVDVIVTDHHEPGPELPAAYEVINPKLYPELPELHVLAGVGVTFKVCHALLKYGLDTGISALAIDLKEGMDLVALGTVADIVPLLGENRCLVRHGMQVLSAQRRPGVRALCEAAKLERTIKPVDIAFRLAPRLNAAGRMGDPIEAMRLLQTTSIVEAYPLAAALDAHNRDRQQEEEQTFQLAREQAEHNGLDDRFSIVVCGHDWHPGVIGIVASRLVQTYHRPAIVLSCDDHGEVHGSGRSIEGVNLVAALARCDVHLQRYGGHPMACGMTLQAPRLEAFAAAFELSVREVCAETGVSRPRIKADGSVQLNELNDNAFAEFELLQPHGHSNPLPSFHMARLTAPRLFAAGRNGTRGLLVDESGCRVPFIAFDVKPEDFPPPPWDVVGSPSLNEYRGQITPQIQIADVRAAV